MNRFQLGLLAGAIFGLATPRAAPAAENIWSGLVVANNVAKPQEIPAELRRIEDTLKDLFGYNQFRVIGQTRTILKKGGGEEWAASSKFFTLRVDSRGEISGRYVLKLQLLEEKKPLLETEAELSKSSPLVVKGPQIGDGQLLLVLIVE